MYTTMTGRMVRSAQLGDHDGHSLHLRLVQNQSRDEVVVPGADEGEDHLHGQGRLHDGQHDGVEGPELAGAVHPGRLHHLHGQHALQILLHVEEDDRRGDAGQDQGQIVVGQVELVHQLDEAHRRNLGRDHHHGHDEIEGELSHLEAVCVDAVSRERGEIGGQHCAAGGDEKAVEHAAGDVDGGVGPGVAQVDDKVFPGNHGEARLQLGVGTGGVDDQHIKAEQTHDRQEDQDDVGYGPRQDQLDAAFGVLSVFHAPASSQTRSRLRGASLYCLESEL